MTTWLKTLVAALALLALPFASLSGPAFADGHEYDELEAELDAIEAEEDFEDEMDEIEEDFEDEMDEIEEDFEDAMDEIEDDY